jgi:hypothetical protein
MKKRTSKQIDASILAADRRLRRHYGITLHEYNLIFAYQGKVCAICKRPVPPGKSRLAVDHCHTTGLVRGLCCWHCNRALSVFRDDPVRLQAAVDYLYNPPASAALKGHRHTAPGRVGSKKRSRLLVQFQKG